MPGGYNRDQQEDRQALLETGPAASQLAEDARARLSRVKFDGEKTLAALNADYMQATDIAEALALKGIPFRTAYKLTGQLVRRCQDEKLPLSKATLAMAQAIDARFDEQVMLACDPRQSVLRKANQGGTGPKSVQDQIAFLHGRASEIAAQAKAVPRLAQIFEAVKNEALT